MPKKPVPAPAPEVQQFKLPSGEIKYLTLNQFLDLIIIDGPFIVKKELGNPVELIKLMDNRI